MNKQNILIGASAALIAAGLFCTVFASERAENVSRETITPQTESVQQAADEQLAEVELERLYTDADAVALAQMAWGECRGVGAIRSGGVTVSGTYQKAAAMWCVLNRYDAGAGESIAAVVAAPKQFHGYSAKHPIDEELLALAYDVLERWQAECYGAADVGRVLPVEYTYFVGDGKHNYFSVEYRSDDYYTWELPDVYM